MAWSNENTQKLLGLYKNKTSIEKLAQHFDVNTISIINKLVREGEYIKPPAKEIVTKKTLLRDIEKITGLGLWSFEKATKNDIKSLYLWLSTR